MPTVTETLVEQDFVIATGRARHASERRLAAEDNVSEQTKLGFLREQQQVGTREATAMQRLDTDKLSQQILQARATKDQPGA